MDLDKTTTPTEAEPQGVAEFVTRLAARFAELDSMSAQLPEVLEMAGQFLGAQRITLSLDEGSSTQELSWINNQLPDSGDLKTFHARLKKSGPNNAIRIFAGDMGRAREPLYLLVAALIDANLAASQAIHAEHSQRLLAESINQISKVLTSTLDREKLLSLFLDQLALLVPYDSANVMLLQNGLLYMHAARGYEDFSGPVDIAGISFVPNRTFLMNEVLAGSQPVILADTHQSPQWTWAPCGEHIRSWMGVPLWVKDSVIGLFSIDKSIPNFFTEKHAALASALARHAALALDNALLYAELQEAHEQLRGFSARILAAQEKERQKIAIELHDHTGQALLALRAELQVLRHNLQKDPEQAREQIDYLDQIVLDLSRDLSQLAYDLRPPTLSALGLVSALEQYVAEFGRRMKIQAEVTNDAGDLRLPEEIELACYRIVQEALTNLARHAQANCVVVSLCRDGDTLRLGVKDNGVGFANHGESGRRGFGLVGIRERLAQIQGTLEINSQPGQGAELVAIIPLAPRSEEG